MSENQTCSVCLKNGELLTNNRGFLQKLRFCVPEINWDEPALICKSCYGNLLIAHTFKSTCFKSHGITVGRPKTSSNASKIPSNASKLSSNPSKTSLEFLEALNQKYERTRSRRIAADVNYDEQTYSDADANEECGLDANQESNKIVLGEITNEHQIHVCAFKKEPEEQILCENLSCDSQVSESTNEDDKEELEFEVKKRKRTRKKKSREKPSVGPFTCEHCAKQFTRKEHVLAHIRIAHTFETPYHCNECDDKFPISNLLLTHKRKVHLKQRPFICSYCGKGFLRSTDLCHHTKIHLNKRQYKCEVCNKGFNTASTLKSHNVCVHTDAVLWKYACSFCDRRFPMKSNLTTHLRRHTGEKKFHCHICDKSFYDKIMLQKHFRSHTDERLFKCHLCEKEYKDNGSLYVHLKKIHGVGEAHVPIRTKNYVCHICPKAFVADEKLQRHIRTHSGVKPFACTACPKKFSDSWYLKKHLKTKHNLEELCNMPSDS